MKSKALVSVIVVMSLMASGLAFAEKEGSTNDEGLPAQQRYSAAPARQADPGVSHAQPNRAPPVVVQPNGVRRDNRQFDQGRGQAIARGASPYRQLHRGDRLPEAYRGRQYVVNDWRGHHLSAPARGYQWVQADGDYALVAIATGVILQLLVNQ